MDLKEFEDWELEKRWREVPGVADVSSFGGMVKQFQVLISPLTLSNYGISISQVVQSLSANNQNSGGGFIRHGEETYNIRGIGKADNPEDIGQIVVAQKGGTPVRIKHLGQVAIGAQPRLGKIAMSMRNPDGSIDDRNDVVEGIILSRTGETDEEVLNGVHEKLKEIKEKYLPSDIQLIPYLDRSELIQMTTKTVEENMASGMILVLVILLFFLGNVRAALIVSATIPLSLLFASILLDIRKIPANLLSLGALDFGMIVDGAVVMVENIIRHKEHRKKQGLPASEENIFQLDHRGGARGRAADRLRTGHHYFVIPSDFHSATDRRTFVLADGMDGNLRVARRSAFDFDGGAGFEFVLFERLLKRMAQSGPSLARGELPLSTGMGSGAEVVDHRRRTRFIRTDDLSRVRRADWL